MTPDEIEIWLTDQVEQIIDETVEESARDLVNLARQRIPLNRRKTRQAVQYRKHRRSTGYRLSLRLNFQTNYPSQGTPTERVWKKSWRPIRANFIRSFDRHLNRRLKRL